MNFKLDHKEIGQLLDRTVAGMDRATIDRLQAARQQALRHQRVAAASWESRNGLLYGNLHLSRRALNWAFAAIVTCALAISLGNWNNLYDRDHSDIDIAILTDDLPVAMYVD